jgi:hypothetical protein
MWKNYSTVHTACAQGRAQSAWPPAWSAISSTCRMCQIPKVFPISYLTWSSPQPKKNWAGIIPSVLLKWKQRRRRHFTELVTLLRRWTSVLPLQSSSLQLGHGPDAEVRKAHTPAPGRMSQPMRSPHPEGGTGRPPMIKPSRRAM